MSATRAGNQKIAGDPEVRAARRANARRQWRENTAYRERQAALLRAQASAAARVRWGSFICPLDLKVYYRKLLRTVGLEAARAAIWHLVDERERKRRREARP